MECRRIKEERKAKLLHPSLLTDFNMETVQFIISGINNT